MHIGFDGKRAFQNKTGLGNYSRSLLVLLAQYYPQHRYTLFAPKHTNLFDAKKNSMDVKTPTGFIGKKFPGWWRRKGIVKDILESKTDFYHGLSNELPAGLKNSAVKKVVTVHDLIFERYPETYHFDERYVHRWKVRHACKIADVIIAISRQTKEDLIEFYNVPPEKITICYQTCSPVFQRTVTDEERVTVKCKYGLPDRFFLFVSSIAPRKNLITICKALVRLKGKIDLPLVVIGDGKKEKEEVKRLMLENGMQNKLILLNELSQSKTDGFITGTDFPAIYQQATALIYPSVFEGFGLPILEALFSGIPVLCSNVSSLPEVAGDAALYFPPMDDGQLAEHMMQVVTDDSIAISLKEKGLQQAQVFAPKEYAQSVMAVYERLV